MTQFVKPGSGLRDDQSGVMKTVLRMDATTYEDERTPTTLPAHAALISGANRLAPHKGWYFAVMVRAAYTRLEGSA